MKPAYRATVFRNAALVVVLVALSGCEVTHRTINTAKDKVHCRPQRVEDAKTTALEVESVEKGKPGYYALVPLAFVADVALTPYYVGWFVHGLAAGNLH
jgi:hypothetical protein